MDYTVNYQDSYGDKYFESFSLTVQGERKYFEKSVQRSLLELKDGTVLDVEIIGGDLHVEPNSEWLNETNKEYELFLPTSEVELLIKLEARGVQFH